MPDSGLISNTAWKLGSSNACDIVVAQPTVSGEHCRLSVQDGKYVLEDLESTNGTFVNGYRLTPRAPVLVSRTDQITLGGSVPFVWPSVPDQTGSSVAAQTLNIGRGPQNEIRLDYPMISWTHARILRGGNQWIIEDLNSANGTALNRIDNKIQRAVLNPGDEIYLGSYKISASKILREKKLVQGEGQFEPVRFVRDHMLMGRDPDSDYPLNYPMISWHHAALERTADGIYVEDLGSRNGTYVNGVRISGRTLVTPGQEIGLGSFRFMLQEDGALAKREYIGNVTIEVASVTIDAPTGARLLDSVSLSIFPSELVALMGPAGAGKTTFLKAINGYTVPAAGQVLFNGDDLYKYYDRFRQQMSYVPQDDIVHAQLTVREALYFTAKLRTDLTDPEIEQRIDTVLNNLGIQDKKNTVIGSPEKKVLSGGQRKRVNIAMELIAEAPVVFLDEPTSGLSSYDAENVVQVLKKLAQGGTTIITTIHQPSLDIYKMFDNLIMISRDRGGCGAMAYFGPAYPDAIEFFNPANSEETRRISSSQPGPETLLSGLAKKPTNEWVTAYNQSRYRKLFVDDRSHKVVSAPIHGKGSSPRGFGFGQWWTLVRRNLILKARDRAQSIILLVQAPLFGILLSAVFRSLQYSTDTEWDRLARSALALQFLMVVAAVWFGCNNVARDIVGEWTIFQRERMVSLKLPSYLFSKLTVAAALSLFQCICMLGIVTLVCHLKGDFFAVLGILYLSSMVGSAIGLCVSARASTTEAAIAMLPLILLPVIALGGGLTPIHLMTRPMQEVAKIVPSRWAFEANLLLEAKGYHYVPGDTAESRSLTRGECFGHDLAMAQFPSPLNTPDTRCPVSAKKAPVHNQSAPRPVEDEESKRTSLRASMVILGGMLVFWLSMALIFLRMRDVH